MKRVKNWKDYRESLAELSQCLREEIYHGCICVLVVCYLLVLTIPALLGFVPDDAEIEEGCDGHD